MSLSPYVEDALGGTYSWKMPMALVTSYNSISFQKANISAQLSELVCEKGNKKLSLREGCCRHSQLCEPQGYDIGIIIIRAPMLSKSSELRKL
jgi:hypothetical protein